MIGVYADYNLIEYMNSYGTEEYEEALFHLKWKQEFHCPKCRHQITVTVGTIMENLKQSLVKWFLALFFMAQNKDSIASAVQRK